MKKTLSFLLVLCMVLALSLKPSKVFASITTDTTTITYDGETFTAPLTIKAEGKNVIIKNCTFSTNNAEYKYACSIQNAGSVTIENNTVTNSLRGFNVDGTALTASGNKITLTQIMDADFAEKNVGIQMNNRRWNAKDIKIEGNIITNATTGIRIHGGFLLASTSTGNIVLGSNTMINVKNYIGVDPAYTEEQTSEQQAALEEILANIVIDNASKVTASADVAYTVIIPTSVDFGKISPNMGTLAKLFPIQVTDALIEDDANITVSLSSEQGMVMKDKNGLGNNTLAFTLGKPSITFTQLALSDHNETVGTNVYCNTANLKAAGSYMGYMTFDISYN